MWCSTITSIYCFRSQIAAFHASEVCLFGHSGDFADLVVKGDTVRLEWKIGVLLEFYSSFLSFSAAPASEPLTRELRETGMLYLREVNIGEKDNENRRGKNKGGSSNQLLAWLQERGLEFMVRAISSVKEVA